MHFETYKEIQHKIPTETADGKLIAQWIKAQTVNVNRYLLYEKM